EVVLDVVVRDKKGRPVKDLAATDFEVYEDGARQKIESFRLYQKNARETTPATAESAKNESRTATAPRPGVATARRPLQGASVVHLVFDRLSPNARELAHKAAVSYVTETFKPDDLGGVFAIDLALHVVQPYTNDQKLLAKALDLAASISSNTFSSSAEQARSQTDTAGKLQDQINASTPTTSGP